MIKGEFNVTRYRPTPRTLPAGWELHVNERPRRRIGSMLAALIFNCLMWAVIVTTAWFWWWLP